jgi:hypothetical protein
LKGYQWTGVPNIMLYHQDNDGDENFRLYKINVTNVNFDSKIPFEFSLINTNKIQPSPFNPVYTINEKPGVKVTLFFHLF